MPPGESSYDDFAIYSEMMFRSETQLGMISGSESSLPVNSDAGTFTDAPTIRSPTETDFTSIVDGIAKSIHFSVSDSNSVTFQSVSSSSSRGKKERKVVSSLRNMSIFFFTSVINSLSPLNTMVLLEGCWTWWRREYPKH